MRRSVLVVPGYESKPVLLARPAHAGPLVAARPCQAIESWFALCRLAPQEFEQLIDASDFPD